MLQNGLEIEARNKIRPDILFIRNNDKSTSGEFWPDSGQNAIGYRCAWEGATKWNMMSDGAPHVPTAHACVDDEMHAIFHCRLYAMQRSLFSDLFETAQSLRASLASNPAHRVALFIEACRNTRVIGLPSVDLDSTLSLGEFDDYDSS